MSWLYYIFSIYRTNIYYIIYLYIFFLGESVDDYGGGYSESIAEMCEELQNGSLPILIETPNGREDTGTSRDCFILNPSATTKGYMKMFELLGKNYLTNNYNTYILVN